MYTEYDPSTDHINKIASLEILIQISHPGYMYMGDTFTYITFVKFLVISNIDIKLYPSLVIR